MKYNKVKLLSKIIKLYNYKNNKVILLWNIIIKYYYQIL
jgi:hypothetical protein